MALSTFLVEASPDVVQAWASRRLPFEPTGPIIEYRAALRAGLAQLEPSAGSFLDACYTGPADRSCDVENVLVYNIGQAAFSHLRLTGLSLVRSFGPTPPVPDQAGPSWPHHHRYQLHAQAWSDHRSGQIVAEWRDVPLRFPLALEAIWYALRTSPSLQVRHGHNGDWLGMDIVVGWPAGSQRALLGIIKVLIDGLMCALHAHNGAKLEILTERLGSRLGVEPADIATLLLSDRLAVLGTRRLLWPYREFVQWNPADDAIVDLRITTAPASTLDTSGTVRSLVRA